MKRILTNSLMLTLAIGLSGCAAWHKWRTPSAAETMPVDNYMQATSIAPLKTPAGLSSDKLKNTYPIPPLTNANAVVQPASVVPPGSGLPPEKTSTKAAATKTQAANNALNANPAQQTVATAATINATAVTINFDYSQAWDKVGQALHASGYRVLQQDSSLGRYYVLDLVSSNGQLKPNTPIYQVQLTEMGNGKTQLTLLDAQNQPANATIAKRLLGAVQSKLAK